MPYKILIIEDEAMLQNAYAYILKAKGYEVFTANNGREGLDQLKRVEPDVILLDMLMPVMDGVEFLKTANVKVQHPKTTVIALSNLSGSNKLEDMLRYGAIKHVLKADLDPCDLVDLVEDACHHQVATHH